MDATREEVLSALPTRVDPEVVEALASRATDGPSPRPLLEGHGTYVFGVLLAAWPDPGRDRVVYQEIDVLATPELVVTVRKRPAEGGPGFDPAGLHHAVEGGAEAGDLVHRLVDEVADTYVTALDGVYGEVEELEDSLETWPPSRVRERLTDLRHELLHARKLASATRAAVRRILDGRVDVGEHALFPPDVERQFADTYETLVRVTEELDVARDLLSGVRDHHQSKVVEGQGEVTKKLTVIASLVLVPSFIVGFYGQNFDSAFDDRYWSIGVSTGLIVGSSILQLALFRWRRWI